MSQVEEFFRDLDRSWPLAAGTPVTLRLLGSTALILQTSFQRGTKDSDILETDQITADIESALLALAGKETAIHRRHRMYLEFIGAAFPFLPVYPLWHAVVPSGLDHQNFRLEVLDVVDVVIAKLARFHKTDRDDISAMAERDLIEPQRFAERFQSAVQRWWHDSRADDLPRIIRNFHQVQSDELFVWPSRVELPRWVEDE
ncbi:hypothetical protein LBMAG42_11060 [Deltaproteobacteria bacterium]|nr:hypothetical protein LBMAG42_11060 [Deltaproteobacteria bacterium]